MTSASFDLTNLNETCRSRRTAIPLRPPKAYGHKLGSWECIYETGSENRELGSQLPVWKPPLTATVMRRYL